MTTTQQQIPVLNNEFISQWFNKFLHDISVDKLSMETDTAPKEKREFYTDAMMGNIEGVTNYVRIQSTQFFISRIVSDYINELREFKTVPQRLAFHFSDAKILVWAQIEDNDEKTEDRLILSEAKSNTKYSENGFYISSTIVEQSDDLKIPPHYYEVKINGGLSSTH